MIQSWTAITTQLIDRLLFLMRAHFNEQTNENASLKVRKTNIEHFEVNNKKKKNK